MCIQNLKSVALPDPELVEGIQKLGGPWLCPHKGMVPFERALVSSYRPSTPYLGWTRSLSPCAPRQDTTGDIKDGGAAGPGRILVTDSGQSPAGN